MYMHCWSVIDLQCCANSCCIAKLLDYTHIEIFFLIFISIMIYHRILNTVPCAIPEKVTTPHSITLAWKIQRTEEPGRLQSLGSLRVRHDWVTSLSLFTFTHWRRKWQPTPVFLPGESQGRGSLVGCRLWGHTESDTTEATSQQHLVLYSRTLFIHLLSHYCSENSSYVLIDSCEGDKNVPFQCHSFELKAIKK